MRATHFVTVDPSDIATLDDVDVLIARARRHDH